MVDLLVVEAVAAAVVIVNDRIELCLESVRVVSLEAETR